MAFEQIAVSKTWKRKRQKQSSGDDVELPALRRNLPRLLFQIHTKPTH